MGRRQKFHRAGICLAQFCVDQFKVFQDTGMILAKFFGVVNCRVQVFDDLLKF